MAGIRSLSVAQLSRPQFALPTRQKKTNLQFDNFVYDFTVHRSPFLAAQCGASKYATKCCRQNKPRLAKENTMDGK